jgi:hypothetical protein
MKVLDRFCFHVLLLDIHEQIYLLESHALFKSKDRHGIFLASGASSSGGKTQGKAHPSWGVPDACESAWQEMERELKLNP